MKLALGLMICVALLSTMEIPYRLVTILRNYFTQTLHIFVMIATLKSLITQLS